MAYPPKISAAIIPTTTTICPTKTTICQMSRKRALWMLFFMVFPSVVFVYALSFHPPKITAASIPTTLPNVAKANDNALKHARFILFFMIFYLRCGRGAVPACCGYVFG
jgi:hypothetical protein